MNICAKVVHGNHICARSAGHSGDCMCHWDQVAMEKR